MHFQDENKLQTNKIGRDIWDEIGEILTDIEKYEYIR